MESKQSKRQKSMETSSHLLKTLARLISQLRCRGRHHGGRVHPILRWPRPVALLSRNRSMDRRRSEFSHAFQASNWEILLPLFNTHQQRRTHNKYLHSHTRIRAHTHIHTRGEREKMRYFFHPLISSLAHCLTYHK